jgi:hypothetical protein
MNEHKLLFGYISTAIAIFSFLIYFWAIYKGQAKPHAFTWFIWGVVNTIGFAAVTVSGGASGAWVLAVNAISCLLIAGIGFYQKHVSYDKYDWLALLTAIIGMVLWQITDNALYAIIFVALADTIGIVPTIRKAYRLPYEENVATFATGVLYYFVAIFALESYEVTNWLYHLIIVISDLVLIAVIVSRRRQIKI